MVFCIFTKTRICNKRTAHVIGGTVHHISSVDELVARAFHADFNLWIAQNNHSPGKEKQTIFRLNVFFYYKSFNVFKGILLKETCPPGIDACRCKIQFVSCLKKKHFRSNLHNQGRLDRYSNGKKCQLKLVALIVFLAIEVFQSPLELQGLVWKKNMQSVI